MIRDILKSTKYWAAPPSIVSLMGTINELGRRVHASQILTEENMERKFAAERTEQDKRLEYLMRMHNEAAREDRNRATQETNRIMAQYFENTKATIENESNKISRQFSQTVLDMEGINYMIQTIDMDLQVTSKASASVADYLTAVTQD